MNCFVNFYLFARTRRYSFRTIVTSTRMNSLCEIYFTLFIYCLNPGCLKNTFLLLRARWQLATWREFLTLGLSRSCAISPAGYILPKSRSSYQENCISDLMTRNSFLDRIYCLAGPIFPICCLRLNVSSEGPSAFPFAHCVSDQCVDVSFISSIFPRDVK